MKLLALTLALCFASLTAFTSGTPGYHVGDKAMDFSLKNVDGKEISLKNYTQAKGFIVVFTCNHCPYAKAYEQRIMDLDQRYAKQGYPVIAINPNDPVAVPDDSFGEMQKRAKIKNYTFPYLLDESQTIAKTYGATRTPHVFLLQKQSDGSLKVAYIGAIDDNSEDATQVKEKYVENAVQALMSNKEPHPDMTKAIGCGIKWKS